MKKQILALLLLGSLAFAIQPAEGWNVLGTGKYTPTGNANVTTEGGNVTNLDLSGNISTEKWAGYWGNVTGGILLTPGPASPAFYSWNWNSSAGGKVCAVAAPSGFDWSGVTNIANTVVDTVWGFTGTQTDSAANTLTGTCSINVAGIPVVGTASELTGAQVDFETCVVGDGGTYNLGDKDNIAFCVEIDQDGGLFNSLTGDYELLTATDEAAGAFETHYFWLELD